jgi:hypothetical protein
LEAGGEAGVGEDAWGSCVRRGWWEIGGGEELYIPKGNVLRRPVFFSW